MVNGDGRNEILSNNSFYLQLVTEETFSRLHLFLNRSVSSYFLGETKFTPGENGERERDVDENFLARSLAHPHDDCIVELGKTIVCTVLIYSLFN